MTKSLQLALKLKVIRFGVGVHRIVRWLVIQSISPASVMWHLYLAFVVILAAIPEFILRARGGYLGPTHVLQSFAVTVFVVSSFMLLGQKKTIGDVNGCGL